MYLPKNEFDATYASIEKVKEPLTIIHGFNTHVLIDLFIRYNYNAKVE